MHFIVAATIALVFSSVLAVAQSTAPVTEKWLYTYRANVTDVYDGDSIIVDVDLGFYIWLHRQEFRLYGINAPEIGNAAGQQARDFLKSKILGKQVIIQSILNPNKEEHKQKGEEFLAIVWIDGINLNDLL